MTETVNDKALRLINTGKVLLHQYDTARRTRSQPQTITIYADVEGDNGTYAVVVIVGETALCGCPARVTCSHILAVMAEALYIQTGEPATASLADDGAGT